VRAGARGRDRAPCPLLDSTRDPPWRLAIPLPKADLSAAAWDDVVPDPRPDARAGGCTTIIGFYQRDVAAPPKPLGAAEIDLRTLVSVPGGSGGRLGDGAEQRFALDAQDPIGLVHEDGQWRVVEHR
jgi:hypothetical protein